MREELDDLIYQRYPSLFGARSQPESGMAWGFTCGDGWFDLIDTLCNEIQCWTADGSMPPVTVVQVKEKFGSLRFRYRGGDEQTRGMVRMAEAMSTRLCEECGAPGTFVGIMTRCKTHALDGAH